MKQQSKEWFEARKGLITGSRAGAILGLSPYKTPQDVMRDMVREYHGLEVEFKGNIATDWGNANEKTALQQFELFYSPEPVQECGFYRKDWFGASPDGLVGDDALVEVKCPFGLRKDEAPAFKPIHEQEHYYIQIQLQLLTTERGLCHFYQWAPHGDSHEIVAFDPDYVSEKLSLLKEFYDAYLVERELPNAQIYLEDKRQKVVSKFITNLVDDYFDIDQQIKELTTKKKDLLAEIVQRSGEKNSEINGHKLTKTIRKGSIDYAKVPELKDVDLEPYRKASSEFWGLK